MPMTTVKTTTRKFEQGNAVRCECNGFSIILEPTSTTQGANANMNPMEAVLCALGGCEALVSMNYAKSNNINLKDVYVEIEGNLDSDGMSVQNVKPGFKDIKCNVYLDTDANDEQVKALTDFIKNKGPVVDTIKNSVQLDIKSVVRASVK
jgi:uncharacterized OsmC-like protein